jgi:phosphoenolpyruvate carboxykinase (ATP)
MPTRCPEVDPAILNPRSSWSDQDAYDREALRLREMFQANFEKQNFRSFGIEAVM